MASVDYMLEEVDKSWSVLSDEKLNSQNKKYFLNPCIIP
jgi:hypothetical protein